MAKQWHQLEKLDHKSLKKLQQEREKAVVNQQKDAERKRIGVVVICVLLAIICGIALIFTIRSRAAKKAFLDAREKLAQLTVGDVSGDSQVRSVGDWERLSKGFVFDKEHTFKTAKGSTIAVEMHYKNLVKIASGSEVVVSPPELHPTENKVVKERVILRSGEVTVAVSLDGREILEIEAAGVVAMGASGLFKVLYNNTKGTGEVVVKNGLVEVFTRSNPTKKIKVSGFYKVTFQQGKVSNPTQASVIQYNWQ
ncbi:MAG TPA: FecR domain-containing protein [Candidatus Ozemobacteraceae bacterium]|nr:FecR domain-containing protein [Candidatus Ozemobacteraceae bacterium]